MWALILILLAPPAGFDKVYYLNEYESEAACTAMIEGVGTGMQDAYPEDTSYLLACVAVEETDAQQEVPGGCETRTGSGECV
jgi:hypothetical protein